MTSDQWGDPAIAGRNVREVPLKALKEVFIPGSGEWTWEQEFSSLWDAEGPYMLGLMESIKVKGIQTPILLGADGRVWDGHRRLTVATSLDLDMVPVVFSQDWEDYE
jgi:hypothetical protein